MDGASAIAGLVGLAGLAAQATKKLTNLVRACKGVSAKFDRNLRWLTQLILLLEDIQGFCAEWSSSLPSTSLRLLTTSVQECLDTVRDLVLKIERRIAHLEENRSKIGRRVSQVKAVFGAKDIEEHILCIRKIVDNLELCYMNIIRY